MQQGSTQTNHDRTNRFIEETFQIRTMQKMQEK